AGIALLGEYKSLWIFKQLEIIAERNNFKITDRIKEIPGEALKVILYVGLEKLSVQSKVLGITRDYKIDFEGIISFIKNQYEERNTTPLTRWAKEYMDRIKCPECNGSRLKKESLYFKLNKKNIAELS